LLALVIGVLGESDVPDDAENAEAATPSTPVATSDSRAEVDRSTGESDPRPSTYELHIVEISEQVYLSQYRHLPLLDVASVLFED